MNLDINIKNFEKLSSNEEKLNYLKSIDFSTVVREANNKYYLFVPGLSISTDGSSLEECFAEIKLLKEKHFTRLIQTKSAEDIFFNTAHLTTKDEWVKEKRQVLRYAITASFVIIIVLFLGWQVDAVVKRTLISASQVVRNESIKFESKIKELRETSVEKRKERIGKFKSALYEVKPYTDAFSEVIFDKSGKSPNKSNN